MKVGNIVYYKKDWKGKRPWYLYSIYKGGLCMIVLLRNGEYTNFKRGEAYLNANIANLPITEIEII